MPERPPRFCSYQGCGQIVARGRCDTHRSQQQAARRQRETWRDYKNPQWLANRKRVLKLEPRCRQCTAPAVVVDHIVPLKKGGGHDLTNLQPLCKLCHDRKTWSETAGRRKRG